MLSSASLRLGVFASILCLSSVASAQTAVNDLFNRANSTNLGPDWSEQNSDGQIVSNRLQGNSPFDLGWAIHTRYNAPYASTVVKADWSMNGGGGDRVSVVIGADVNWGGIEIRIGDNNGDGTADRIFFNAAINAGNWPGGPGFANLATPIITGTVTVWFTNGGNTVNVAIGNPATNTVETFTNGGVLGFAPTGTGVAVGYFGNGWIDNFRAYTGSPAGPDLSLTPPRQNTTPTLLVGDAVPNGSVLIAFSLTGAGPQPTPLGNVYLTDPIYILGTLPTDGQGRGSVPIGPLTSALVGVTFTTQAVDLTSFALSNYVTSTVF